MRFISTLLLSLLASLSAAETSKPSKSAPKPCTIFSPTTGSYYDLNQIQLRQPSKSASKDARIESWHSRGYDYGANFTINFCGPVLEDLGKVDGIPEQRVANVSAFYQKGGTTYSIGQANSEPIFRGRKLVLNYTDGSPCPDVASSSIHSFRDDDGKKSVRHKSTVLSFLCDRDPQFTDHPQISFISSPDSCSYFFEVRSRAACGGAISQSPSSLGPGGVFVVILAIAICVYLVGGCAYQRTVMHQRGWRQCPNWAVWKGIADFLGVSKFFTSSSGRFGKYRRLDQEGWEPGEGIFPAGGGTIRQD